MRLSNWFPVRNSVCLVLGYLATGASSYFVITTPKESTTWSNGATNVATWVKGLHDGIVTFDVELSRLSTDGLTLVARDVPAIDNSINIVLQDIPPGDDYFLLFINSTHGHMYASSPRFTILDASATASSGGPSIPTAATVIVSGSPNPTKDFATTFPAVTNGVSSRWSALNPDVRGPMWGIAGVMVGCFVGAAWTLW